MELPGAWAECRTARCLPQAAWSARPPGARAARRMGLPGAQPLCCSESCGPQLMCQARGSGPQPRVALVLLKGRPSGTQSVCLFTLPQDIQQLLQLQQLVLVPGHHLQPPAQFLLPQAQQSQPGEPPRGPPPLWCPTASPSPPPRSPLCSPLPRAAPDAKSIPATSANPGSSPDPPAPGGASHTGEAVHHLMAPWQQLGLRERGWGGAVGSPWPTSHPRALLCHQLAVGTQVN